MDTTPIPSSLLAPLRQTFLGALREEAWQVLLPQRCIVCERFGAALHEGCLDLLPAADGARCDRCWRPGVAGLCDRCVEGGPDTPVFDALRTPFRFEGLARRALLEAKFRGVTAHLGRRRERTRGFNQAYEVARAVAETLGVALGTGLVRRQFETSPQAMLGAGARRTNLRGAFVLDHVPPERVLVVDDVTTTGTTLSAVAGVLRAGGAQSVMALAVARED